MEGRKEGSVDGMEELKNRKEYGGRRRGGRLRGSEEDGREGLGVRKTADWKEGSVDKEK